MKLCIRELREEYAMTQRQLADALGTMQRNVSNWENGTSEPDCETILHIAELFRVSLDELFGRLPGYEEHETNGKKLVRAVLALSGEQKSALLDFLKTIKN